MDTSLPKGWNSSKVEALAELVRGITYKKEQARNAYEQGYKPILRANNISGSLNFDSLVYVPEELIDSKQYIQKSDIIFAMSSGSKHLVGKSARAIADFDGSYGAFCGLVRPNKKIFAPFLFYSFQDNRFKHFIQQVSKGSNINNLKREHILEYLIFHPSIDEQESIVAKIEELFSELDSGIASLKTAQEQLKIYRQSLLKHAFEGKLTEQWRKDNADKLETPEQLLARIQAERETRYQQQLDEWKQEVKAWEENGKDGRKPRKPKITKLDSDMPLGDFVEIPNSWAWCQFGSLYEMISGFAFKKADYSNSGVRLFQIANVSFSKTLWDEVTYLPEIFAKKFPELVLEENDVVMALNRPMLGDRLKVTKLSKADTPSILYQRVGKFIFYNTDISSYFLYFLQSTQFTSKLKEELRGVNIPFINQTRLAKYYIPICSVSEQQEIVNQLEEKLSIIEQNEKEIESALAKAELLRQSILKKAFSGQLIKDF